jgi:hypothetical protein
MGYEKCLTQKIEKGLSLQKRKNEKGLPINCAEVVSGIDSIER